MSIKLQQKYKEIFEVKIKQDRLCQLLESFNIKLHTLEDSQRAIQATLSMSNILDQVKKYVKALVKEENTQMMYKFYEKIESCNKEINRIEYSYKNFEKNIRTDFEGLHEKEKLLEKTVSYMNIANSQQTAKLQGEIESVQMELGINKVEVLNELQAEKQKVSEGHEKINALTGMLEDGEEKLDYFQETLSSLSKKVNQFRQHEPNIGKNQAEKERNHFPVNQLIKKSRVSGRKTIDSSLFKSSELIKEKQKQLHDSKEAKETKEPKPRRQSKDVKQNDISAITKKIQTLQKKVSVIIENNQNPLNISQNNERDSIISTTQLAQLAQLSKFDSNKNIQKMGNRSSPIRKSNNYKRGSIRTEDVNDSAGNIEDHARSNFANSNNANEIRRINQKLTNIHFKYTLLQENYDNLLGKMNKLSSLEGAIQSKIEEAQKMRVDANTVNEIKLRFKQIQTAMELQEIRYVNHSTYQKEVDVVRKKLADIDATIPKLAKKDEVVAAFAFIQNKIKEIVTVLSTKFQQDKLGAINKIQNIRCLTCDKQANLAQLSQQHRINVRTSQANRFSLDRHEVSKRFKTQQNQ